MIKSLIKTKQQQNILTELSDAFIIKSIKLLLSENCTVMQDETVEVELRLYSKLPKDVDAECVAISLQFNEKKVQKQDKSGVNGSVDDDNCDSRTLRTV